MGPRIKMLETVEDSHGYAEPTVDGKLDVKYHVYMFRKDKIYDGRMKVQAVDSKGEPAVDEFNDPIVAVVEMPGDWRRRAKRLIDLGKAVKVK